MRSIISYLKFKCGKRNLKLNSNILHLSKSITIVNILDILNIENSQIKLDHAYSFATNNPIQLSHLFDPNKDCEKMIGLIEGLRHYEGELVDKFLIDYHTYIKDQIFKIRYGSILDKLDINDININDINILIPIYNNLHNSLDKIIKIVDKV